MTATPTLGVLGTRRFSINPQTSSFVFVLPGLEFPHTGFQGFLDLTAGKPDPVTGRVSVDITAASPFISLDLNPDAAFTLCLRPLNLPVTGAGVLDCDGGSNLDLRAMQDHHIGEVGVNGFTEADCAGAGGTVEAADAPHPGVCNGPLEIQSTGDGDSGAGALQVGFDVAGLQGLPVELTVEAALPCGDEGPGVATSFGFVTGLFRAVIDDVDDTVGSSLVHDETGENFSCWNWSQENGPGRLVVGLPALHGFAGADLISVFVLDD